MRLCQGNKRPGPSTSDAPSILLRHSECAPATAMDDTDPSIVIVTK